MLLLCPIATPRGHIRGRALRFPTISIRPGGGPTARLEFRQRHPARTARLPGLPARAARGAATCGCILASPDIGARLHAAGLRAGPGPALGADTTLTLPGITVTGRVR